MLSWGAQRLRRGVGTGNHLSKTQRNVADGGTTMKFFSGNRPTTASLLVMLTAVLLLAQTALHGQATGNVTGVVADTTGGVIPKATVILADPAGGGKRS